MGEVELFGLFEDDQPQKRLDAEQVLEGLCMSAGLEPPEGLREKLLGRLGFSGSKLNLADLPPTDKYSNHLSWLAAISPLIPPGEMDPLFLREIRKDDHLVQTLVVSRVDVPEEVHDSYQESFFILEGRCVCSIGGSTYELNPGDYLEIPLHVPHDVRLLSPHVTAILQYRFM